MKLSLGNIFLTAVAVAVGLVTLLGYFVDVPVVLALRLQLVSWASLLAAVAVLIGVLNLAQVHGRRTVTGAANWPYSLVLVLVLIGTIGVGLIASLSFLNWGSGPTNAGNAWIFRYVQTAVATSLSGLLVFFLVFAGYRLLRRRLNLTTVVFVVVAVVSLLGMAPLPDGMPDLGLRQVWIWISQVPAVAGARGLLLGLGLGIVATGLRVLMGVDRPYGE